jgi:hypothetical protein
MITVAPGWNDRLNIIGGQGFPNGVTVIILASSSLVHHTIRFHSLIDSASKKEFPKSGAVQEERERVNRKGETV